ncbi:hypothetical protein [Janthinobacterium sp. 61]|uniref:hypothetical protein n=1 Tax=Janthinobacterium sp. 61 TaxID=2035209 RepID=UPI001179CE30|nr:hypothetical protein [Janthinobacterium sp. 61]
MPLTFDVARMLHPAQLPLPRLGLAPRPRSCKRCARRRARDIGHGLPRRSAGAQDDCQIDDFFAANYLKRRFVDAPDENHASRMTLAYPMQLFKGGAQYAAAINLKLTLKP